MRRLRALSSICLLVALLILSASQAVEAEGLIQLDGCKEFAFSTEEDFVTQGPVPSDGNPIISDGDLLSDKGIVCARNSELLSTWKITQQLGLDAVDVLSTEQSMVAFSTELDAPNGVFQEGDLLATNGMVIPNLALLTKFQVDHDLGLDAVHFVGTLDGILAFLAEAGKISRDQWLSQDPSLQDELTRFQIDIWFSTEGTERRAATQQILDGYLLSARDGIIILNQAQFFASTSVPADIPKPADTPKPGIDFGLDGATSTRAVDWPSTLFSTEILYDKEPPFTDGDILQTGTAAIVKRHNDLVLAFEPKTGFIGVDALYKYIEEVDPGNGEGPIYLPNVRKAASGTGGAQ